MGEAVEAVRGSREVMGIEGPRGREGQRTQGCNVGSDELGKDGGCDDGRKRTGGTTREFMEDRDATRGEGEVRGIPRRVVGWGR
jgi:hypothetical protein